MRVRLDSRVARLQEVIAHLGASGKTGIIDGTEIRVRRPAAGRKDRDRFISGKNKQNAVKTMVVTDGDGRVLFCSPTRPGRSDRRPGGHTAAPQVQEERPGLVRGDVRA
ncbi:transposase family protein, partial [Streptomyces cellulosae]